MALPNIKDWQRYELELISCIRYDHPIIYKEFDGIDKARRAIEIKNAWEAVAQKFEHSPFRSHQATWRNINLYFFNKYLKPKYRGLFVMSNEDLNLDKVSIKYKDGTLDFLEDEFVKMEKVKAQYEKNSYKLLKRQAEQQIHNVRPKKIAATTIDVESSTSNSPIPSTSGENLEVNKINTAIIKEELPQQEETTEANKKVTVLARSKQKAWNEEELLNATRLTQEMILELIRIKCRNAKVDDVVELDD